ncbi:MAG: hypothetical protein KAV18_03930 [Candidatus Omnitrophica bacterium]|nr:hypothetical protein [Candidatus Omnitrophota bacterium]
MKIKFKWIGWNIEHIAEHGVTPEEAESVFNQLVQGYPRRKKDYYMVWGKSYLDQWLQLAFAKEDNGRYFIFHARPLTVRERRRIK